VITFTRAKTEDCPGYVDVELALVGRNPPDDRHAEHGTAPLLNGLRVEIERSVYASLTTRW